MKILFDYNRTLYDPKTGTLYPGAVSVLAELSVHNELFLISQNEKGRNDRLNKLGVRNYFKEVYFVDKKTEEFFMQIIGTDPAMIVGDNLSNEIRIGNLINVTTIHIDHTTSEIPSASTTNGVPNFTVKTIDEITKIIQKYEY
jgi:FMN phosphatase YigB (HAD superfamily)